MFASIGGKRNNRPKRRLVSKFIMFPQRGLDYFMAGL